MEEEGAGFESEFGQFAHFSPVREPARGVDLLGAALTLWPVLMLARLRGSGCSLLLGLPS